MGFSPGPCACHALSLRRHLARGHNPQPHLQLAEVAIGALPPFHALDLPQAGLYHSRQRHSPRSLSIVLGWRSSGPSTGHNLPPRPSAAWKRGLSQATAYRAPPRIKSIQEVLPCKKSCAPCSPALFLARPGLLPTGARAMSCPASLSVTLSPTGADLITSHNATLTAATVTPGNADVVCSYTAHLLLLHYSPRVLSATTKAACDLAGNAANPATCSVCQPFAVNAAIPTSTPPPPTGFSPWAFGSPGTSDTHVFTPVLAQLIGNPPPKSNPPSGKALISSCNVSGNGAVGFAVYPAFQPATPAPLQEQQLTPLPPSEPPLCQPTLKGSKFPTANWSAGCQRARGLLCLPKCDPQSQ